MCFIIYKLLILSKQPLDDLSVCLATVSTLLLPISHLFKPQRIHKQGCKNIEFLFGLGNPHHHRRIKDESLENCFLTSSTKDENPSDVIHLLSVSFHMNLIILPSGLSKDTQPICCSINVSL